jgi:uncharacterized protein (TIGR03086 family)
MDLLDHLDGAFTSTGRVMVKVTPGSLGAPTPCLEWDVCGLLDHMTGVMARFAATASRTDPGPDTRFDWVDANPAATFDEVAKGTLAAWSQPGALDGMCRVGPGTELPAEIAIRINFLDTLVHGWDLAKALGLDPTLDPALAAAALEAAQMVVRDDLRGPGKGFGAIVALTGGASPTDRLVAFLGRRP